MNRHRLCCALALLSVCHGAMADDIRIRFQEVSGPIPVAVEGWKPEYEVLETAEFPEHIRKKIRFEVEEGDWLYAYLSEPKRSDGPFPAMLCLHPTSPHGKGMVVGLGDKPNRSYASELAEGGFVTLAPDYPGFGDYKPDVYAMGYDSATAKGIFNHMRCIDLLQSLEQVDAERVGAIGHSLGGHNTLFASLFDERIKVMVTSCGFNAFSKYYGGDLTGWSHKGYMPWIAEKFGKDPERMPWDFPELLAVLAPRPVFINAPKKDANFEVSGIEDCVAVARPKYEKAGAGDNLAVVYPDCAHDFPTEIRHQAYAFIRAALMQAEEE